MIFRDFRHFFMCLDAPGTIGTLGNTEGGGLACPTLQNGMLFRFLGHFSLISHYFSRFYAFFTRLDAPGGSRGTREHRRGCRPSKMVCYFDFSAILAYFSLFFAILGVFHVFGCTWKAYYGNKTLNFRSFSWFHAFFTRLDAPGRPRNTGEAKRVNCIFSEYFSWFFVIYFVYIINILHFVRYPYGYPRVFPHPWLRVGFGAGTGAGHLKFTRGWPVLITRCITLLIYSYLHSMTFIDLESRNWWTQSCVINLWTTRAGVFDVASSHEHTPAISTAPTWATPMGPPS